MTRILSDTKFTTEITAQEIARRYLADNGMVAINRRLAEHLAECGGGGATTLMLYVVHLDEYCMSDKARDLIYGSENLKQA